MNRMKRLLAAALTFAATLSLASCGTSNSEDSVGQTPAPPSQTAESQSAGRELSMALSVDPDGLDPQRTTAASTFQIMMRPQNIQPLLRETRLPSAEAP